MSAWAQSGKLHYRALHYTQPPKVDIIRLNHTRVTNWLARASEIRYCREGYSYLRGMLFGAGGILLFIIPIIPYYSYYSFIIMNE